MTEYDEEIMTVIRRAFMAGFSSGRQKERYRGNPEGQVSFEIWLKAEQIEPPK